MRRWLAPLALGGIRVGSNRLGTPACAGGAGTTDETLTICTDMTPGMVNFGGHVSAAVWCAD